MQADRRRLPPPAGGTTAPLYLLPTDLPTPHPTRSRTPHDHRKIFLQTGIVPSASGSAYYEIPPSPSPSQPQPNLLRSLHPSTLKLTCTIHGPRPLPRNAAFSPNLLLNTHIKFASFASRKRRAHVRDSSERDLGVHLETALRGVVVGERWPKSAVEVVVTVLEGEEDAFFAGREGGPGGGWGMMNVLAGCITVAGAALVDAGIDCVDLVSGGVAAVVGDVSSEGRKGGDSGKDLIVLDPSPSEHSLIRSACVVAYLASRDEITQMWMKGDVGGHAEVESLLDSAVQAARLTRTVLVEAVRESVEAKIEDASKGEGQKEGRDVVMKG